MPCFLILQYSNNLQWYICIIFRNIIFMFVTKKIKRPKIFQLLTRHTCPCQHSPRVIRDIFDNVGVILRAVSILIKYYLCCSCLQYVGNLVSELSLYLNVIFVYFLFFNKSILNFFLQPNNEWKTFNLALCLKSLSSH